VVFDATEASFYQTHPAYFRVAISRGPNVSFYHPYSTTFDIVLDAQRILTQKVLNGYTHHVEAWIPPINWHSPHHDHYLNGYEKVEHTVATNLLMHDIPFSADEVDFEEFDVLAAPALTAPLPRRPVALVGNFPTGIRVSRIPSEPVIQPDVAPIGTPLVICDSPNYPRTSYPHLRHVHTSSDMLSTTLRMNTPEDDDFTLRAINTLDHFERENSIFTELHYPPTVKKLILFNLDKVDMDGHPEIYNGVSGDFQIVARHVVAPSPSQLSPSQINLVDRKLLKPHLKAVADFRDSKSPDQWMAIIKEFDSVNSKSRFSRAFPKNDPPKKTVASGAHVKQQGVTALPPYIQHLFAAWVAGITAFLKVNIRKDLYVDLGYSEEELAAIFTKVISTATMNTEVDLSSQDSTHERGHVDYIMHLSELAGLNGLHSQLFKHVREYDAVQPLNNTWVSESSIALGSGAPWTLLCNCVMMLTSLCLDSSFDDTFIAAQKGDDFYTNKVIKWKHIDDRVFKGVKYEVRFSKTPSFCSRVHAHAVIRKLARPLARLEVLAKDPLRRVPQLAAALQALDNIYTVGIDHYASLLSAGFDLAPVDALVLVHAFAFKVIARLREGLIDFPKLNKTQIVTVNAPVYCVHEALEKVCGVAVARQHHSLRVHNVPYDVALSVLSRYAPVIQCNSYYNPESYSRIVNKDPQFVGFVMFLDHVVGRYPKTTYYFDTDNTNRSAGLARYFRNRNS